MKRATRFWPAFAVAISEVPGSPPVGRRRHHPKAQIFLTSRSRAAILLIGSRSAADGDMSVRPGGDSRAYGSSSPSPSRVYISSVVKGRPFEAVADREGSSCRVGPGNFTPSLSQIPDVNLSIHPARVTARRLPPSAEPSGSSRYDPVGPSSTAMTCPLRSTGITPLRRYYEAVRPSPAHRYFRPRGWSRLCLFPWHRRPGSHVPYKSQIELRAAYMPDAAWAVSGHPPS